MALAGALTATSRVGAGAGVSEASGGPLEVTSCMLSLAPVDEALTTVASISVDTTADLYANATGAASLVLPSARAAEALVAAMREDVTLLAAVGVSFACAGSLGRSTLLELPVRVDGLALYLARRVTGILHSKIFPSNALCSR